MDPLAIIINSNAESIKSPQKLLNKTLIEKPLSQS